MNVIGFLKLHNPEIICSKDLLFGSSISKNVMEGVIFYLRNGVAVTAFTLSLTDIDKEFIGPYIIYSDGEWIWPSYYSFYLQKYDSLNVSSEFIAHVSKTKGEKIEVTKEKLIYAEYCVSKLLGINLTKLQIPSALRVMIEKNGDELFCF